VQYKPIVKDQAPLSAGQGYSRNVQRRSSAPTLVLPAFFNEETEDEIDESLEPQLEVKMYRMAIDDTPPSDSGARSGEKHRAPQPIQIPRDNSTISETLSASSLDPNPNSATAHLSVPESIPERKDKGHKELRASSRTRAREQEARSKDFESPLEKTHRQRSASISSTSSTPPSCVV